ncbi:hypothetical protein NEHOM01_0449 [Nematocida homosporus]|uniref:uncharacterized protein n=1 Tax=Nematocida homosporus TaxID=1912981 RepID=UPI00221FFF39|nr:uncharacterized protein NEHOM01_0449 [Nematocida homosporus]KAI5184898.1 hypothetical protein NEHOM01_0449 [Nematocida homosporus]
MLYFKRLDINELDALPFEEKERSCRNIVAQLDQKLSNIPQDREMLKKLEYFLPYLDKDGLCLLIDQLVFKDVFCGPTAFFIEKMLKQCKLLADSFDPTATEQVTQFISRIQSEILQNPKKAFKSKGVNHIIRELLNSTRDKTKLLAAIAKVPLEYFLDDPTRLSTYKVYLDVLEGEPQTQLCTKLIDYLEIEMLTSYQSFIYQKVCSVCNTSDKQRLFKKVSPHLPELAKDKVANYFVQSLIMNYPAAETFTLLVDSLGSLPSNSNVLFSLGLKACQDKHLVAVEYLVENIWLKDMLIKRLLFNEKGGFDSKTHQLAIALLSLTSKYLADFQLEVISLYEKYWLFDKIGQKVLIALFSKPIDPAIKSLLIGTMAKEFLGIMRTKGGPQLLTAIEKVSDFSTRKRIRLAIKNAPYQKRTLIKNSLDG